MTTKKKVLYSGPGYKVINLGTIRHLNVFVQRIQKILFVLLLQSKFKRIVIKQEGTTLSITTFSITTFSITTLNIMTLSIAIINVTQYCYAECRK